MEGLDRRVQGALARDNNNHIWLLHRGKIGGGKPGIGRKLFFENYHGEVTEVAGNRFTIIGDISSLDFVESVKDFVQEVNRIKNLVT
jgi:hypothetical protein